VFLSENTINWFCFPVQITLTRYGYSTAGVSKWAGTRYFYPPEIVYSTVRNYWTETPKISGGQNHKYDGRLACGILFIKN
jgi:hypothetical protein